MNGTLRKQHSALFLVPGVSTALAAQKRRIKRLRPQGCGANPVTPTIKNTHALFALCVFYLPEIRDLNDVVN